MKNRRVRLRQRNVRFVGFCDGAGVRLRNPEYYGDAEYETGYVDGEKARRRYFVAVTRELKLGQRHLK